MSTEIPESSALPTNDNPQTKKTVRKKKTTAKQKKAEATADTNAIASAIQQFGNLSGDALKGAIGLIANIASVGSYEKVDYKNGKHVTDGISIQKRRFRSTENMSEKGRIETAINQQKKELEEAKNAPIEKPKFVSLEDLMVVIYAANDELQARIFGPMWNNWTNAEDFLAIIKDTLGNIISTFDPLMDAVDELQEYFYGKVSYSFGDANIHLGTSRRGESLDLPVGIIALQALDYIIDFIRDIIRNVEMLAETYTSEELYVLMKKSTHTSNWSSFIKAIQDLLKLIVDAIKPYIQNIIIALILDAIDMIVDVLDKAGLLSPKGPLKLIPVAITLVRSIMAGNLEAIEEMVKQTLTKLANMVFLAGIALKDPSILWADTDRMDKEINIARYKELISNEKYRTKSGKLNAAGRKAFYNYDDANYTSSVRHFLQKMKTENSNMFGQIADKATKWSDLTYWINLDSEAESEQSENEATSESIINEVSNDMQVLNKSIEKGVEEPE
jgi:hypothetical protein